ncbi:nitrogenase molybdenum-iron protein alpha subunit NifD [Gottschalkia acidurici 9a]|uniref:Nitrogenase molybdenum-iron protein alpha subunit NifD n=1 Tax=Gottschalkia acidurici (strain ATCC 7906 / DSM 604 / BCRC 14475 / CIP 104303 / KCTC 5404 / NCIMB 10678 / 9a) TaxID=1128398 RepID=K0B225_GOTA9|nr:nitrogenase component 1 [Gottschalkia acidurici]AFS79167.1 nitrogenase molybdenum-iron protein alpha subunit NifD [Gottschalkia acidurici 9a]
MDYIKSKTPPVREDRLGACNSFGGCCSSLLEKSKKGCLNNSKRTFYQTQGCQLNLSLATLNTIRDSVVIVHSPIGCGSGNTSVAGITTNYQKLRDSNSRGLIWVNTNLNETDVISGGEKKLKDAVLYVEKEFSPESIIVVNSCVPALIGDDIDGILTEVQNEVTAKIVPVHCEGFKTKIMASAYDAVFHGILRNLVYEKEKPKDEKAIREKNIKENRTINLLNVSSMSKLDETELIRLLEKLGLEVRVLPCYSHPDDFQDMLDAALNVSICATHDDYFVEHLKSKYDIPFILKTIPIGIKNTNRWIRDIAEFFGLEKEAEGVIESENKALKEALEPFRKSLSGRTALLAGGEIRVLATAELLEFLDIKIIGMRGYHYDHFANELIEGLEGDKNKIIFNAATGQPFEQSNIIERLKPDIYIGHTGGNVWAAKHGVPILPIFGQTYNYMGYSGSFEIIRRLNRVLKNTIFNKNITENIKPPYFEEWYKENPFLYIEEPEEILSEALSGAF